MIGPDVMDLTKYIVTFDGVNSETEGERLVREYSDIATLASYSTGTLTITFQG